MIFTNAELTSLGFSDVRRPKLPGRARSKVSKLFVSHDNLFPSWSHD
jgi:hypothetical protein